MTFICKFVKNIDIDISNALLLVRILSLTRGTIMQRYLLACYSVVYLCRTIGKMLMLLCPRRNTSGIVLRSNRDSPPIRLRVVAVYNLSCGIKSITSL